MSLSLVTIFEYPDFNSVVVRGAKPFGKLHFLMAHVIVTDEPAHETYYDGLLRGA